MTERELNEEKKAYLRGYKRVCNRIKTLGLQIQEVREAKQQAKAQELSDMPKGNKQSDLSDYIVKLERLEEKVAYKLEEKKREKIEIENAITDVPDDVESDILYKRYIQLMDWEEIAEEIGYSVRHVYRYHGEALHDLKYTEKDKDVTPCH